MLNKKQARDIKASLYGNDRELPTIFRALGDQNRFYIFKVILHYQDICVTDIANIFGITVSAASQQLRVLERLGLVFQVRMGQIVCYEINYKNPIVKQLCKLLKRPNK